VYDRTAVSPELQNKFAEILATLLEIFARSTKIIKGGLGGRVLRFAKNALLGNDQTLQSLVSKLEKLSQSEHRLVGAETLVESKKTGVAINDLSVKLAGASLVVQDSNIKLDQVSVDVRSISSGQDELREAMHQEMNNVMAAIARSNTKDDEQTDHGKQVLRPSVSPHDTYYSIAKKRLPGSGDWIREEPQFEAWLQRKNSILWISGIPGSGKSFLAGNIIAYLKEQDPHEVANPSQTSVAYFFFKDSDPQTRSIHQALRDVAYQIYQNDQTYAQYLHYYCQSADDIKTIQSAWRVLFQNFFLNNDSVRDSVYVVLDGLDEASEEDRRAFSELLSDLSNAGTDGERIL
jgi:outer membrane murein-binding lipoprotein Lpp